MTPEGLPGKRSRRILAIANPHAGTRAAQEVLDQGRALLSAADIELDVAWTEAPRHGVELAGAVDPSRYSAVCAVGGDGTAFEVLQGLFQHAAELRPPLAYVPAGSGNSVALDLGCADPAVAWAAVAADRRRRIDVAEVELDGEAWIAANVLAWGAGARMNAKAERMRWAGGRRYDLAAVAELFAPRLASAGASIDGVRDETLLLGVASLTRHSGRGMCVAPAAKLDDGELDLITIAKGPRLKLAKVLSQIYTGDHVASPLVTCARRSSLHLVFDPGSHLVVDGELMQAREARVQVHRQALEVFAGGEE